MRELVFACLANLLDAVVIGVNQEQVASKVPNTPHEVTSFEYKGSPVLLVVGFCRRWGERKHQVVLI